MLCRLDETELAKQQLRSLFSLQENDGFVGHMILWRAKPSLLPSKLEDVLQIRPTWRQPFPTMSALVQPPLVAQALTYIYEATNDKEFLAEMLPKLKLFFDWLRRNRDFNDNGLLSIITPYESGVDYKPAYDEVLGFSPGKGNYKLYWKAGRIDFINFKSHYNLPMIYKKNRFIVQDILFNTFYGWDLDFFSKLLKVAGNEEATDYQLRSSQTVSGIINQYDDKSKAFYDTYGHHKKFLKVDTPTIFAPLILSQIPKDIADAVIKEKFEAFANLPFPVPSVAPYESSFSATESHYIWRGPTWIIYNWLLYKILISRDYTDHANSLKKSTLNLIEKSGFREYYNPYTGEGYGATNFTWSGLVLDMEA